MAENTDRYKGILDKVSDCVLTHVGGIITYINDESARVTGYSKDELLKANLMRLIPPEYASDIQSAIKRRRSGDTDSFLYQIEILAKNGTRVPVEIKSSALRDGDIENEILIVARDISDRIEQSERQRRMEENLKIQLDLTIKTNKTSDLQQIFLHYLESAMQASSMDSGGVYMVRKNGDLDLVVSKGLSKRFLDKVSLFHGGSEVSKIASRGLPIITEAKDKCTLFDDATREEGLVSTVSFPVKNEGKVIACINLASRKLVSVSRETRDCLAIITSNIGSVIARAEADSFKQHVFSTIAHELRTPLTSIHGAVELLDRKAMALDPYLNRMVNLIKRGSNRLQALIDNILDFSMIETDHMSLNKEKIDVVSVVNDIVQDMLFLTAQKSLSITLHLPEKLIIQGDKLKIEQVFVNLVSNAIKNTSNDGHIHLSGKIDQDIVEIAVKDDGIGITKEELPILFTKFGKLVRSEANVDIQGTGLGLYISRAIIEMHGGQVWAQSEGRGKGSTFVIHLPVGNVTRS